MKDSKPFIFLCLVGFCSFVSYDMVRRPALALFVESFGAGPFLVGLLVAVSTVTGIVLKLPMGLLSDQVNRQRLMLGGVLAFALPPFLYPFISDLWTLGILRLFHGLATAMFTPLALAMVGELFAKRRGEAFGWYTSATQGGGLLGPMIGGAIVYQYGFAPTFLLAGLFGMFALIFFWGIPQTSTPSRDRQHSASTVWKEMREGLRRVCQIPPILITSIVEAAKMMGNGTLMAFLPLYGLVIGLNAAEIGILFGVQALTSFIAKPVMGRISDRGVRPPLIVGGLCLCGLMVMCIPHIQVYGLLLAVAGAFGFGEAVVTSSTTALVADFSEGKDLGAGMGLRGTIMDIGHAGGPLLAGILIHAFGYGGGFFCVGVILLLTAAFFGARMIGIKKPVVL
ncbi:MAG TPA: MFS transporter [Nitrospiraceae bacterium]|nr:MFS transporter [Nitrospiraceae bacterium]